MKLTPHILPLVLFVLVLFTACKTDEPIVSAQSVTLNKSEDVLAVGDSVALIATLLPDKAQGTVVWTSSNEKVAIVTEGLVKGLARGSATIKVTVDSLLYSTCVFTVTADDLPYELVWSEEFDGDALDLTKWNYEIGGYGWGNSEKQYYTDRTENVRLEDGSLIIEAKKETYKEYTNSYTSARITTKTKALFAYGKMEARISLPAGKGTWPAFWMLGATSGWPYCGEIDIMEHIGSDPTMISHATHTSEKNGSRGNNWFNRQYVDGVEGNYHTYAIEWEKAYSDGDDNISFYIDGVKSTTSWQKHVDSTLADWPFNKDFYFILNLAIGGTMGGTVDDSIFDVPVIMKVDYVRVYQRK